MNHKIVSIFVMISFLSAWTVPSYATAELNTDKIRKASQPSSGFAPRDLSERQRRAMEEIAEQENRRGGSVQTPPTGDAASEGYASDDFDDDEGRTLQEVSKDKRGNDRRFVFDVVYDFISVEQKNVKEPLQVQGRIVGTFDKAGEVTHIEIIVDKEIRLGRGETKGVQYSYGVSFKKDLGKTKITFTDIDGVKTTAKIKYDRASLEKFGGLLKGTLILFSSDLLKFASDKNDAASKIRDKLVQLITYWKTTVTDRVIAKGI